MYEPARRDTTRGSSSAISRRADQAISRIGGSMDIAQATIRAKSRVNESAMHEVAFLKATQHALARANPDVASALDLIANATVISIARTVAQFGQEWD
jgi:hypothetical protein